MPFVIPAIYRVSSKIHINREMWEVVLAKYLLGIINILMISYHIWNPHSHHTLNAAKWRDDAADAALALVWSTAAGLEDWDADWDTDGAEDWRGRSMSPSWNA